MCQTCNQIPCVRDAVELVDAALVDTATLELRVDEVWSSDFGAALFNLVTSEEFTGKRRLFFSGRRKLTLQLIRTLLLEQEKLEKRESL